MTAPELVRNEHGGLVIRQSDLASFQRCAYQVHLIRRALQEGWHEPVLSATSAGSVYHYAAMVLLKLHHEGREDALEVAQATFRRYWDPEHIREIGLEPVDEWIGHDTWGGLQHRHLLNLAAAYEWVKREKSVLLALEHTFDVPYLLDGAEHILHGTVDMLRLRMISGRPALAIDDWKTHRRRHYHLDLATQWTVYSFASLQSDFWEPFLANDVVADGLGEVMSRLEGRGLSLWPRQWPTEDRAVIPRRGRLLRAWDGLEVQDCGWRTEAHYARLEMQIRQYVKAVELGVYPLTVDGQVCTYCPFNRDLCPLPERQRDLEEM